MQMTFIFVLISVTLFWALELQSLTCNVKQLNSSKIVTI